MIPHVKKSLFLAVVVFIAASSSASAASRSSFEEEFNRAHPGSGGEHGGFWGGWRGLADGSFAVQSASEWKGDAYLHGCEYRSHPSGTRGYVRNYPCKK